MKKIVIALLILTGSFAYLLLAEGSGEKGKNRLAVFDKTYSPNTTSISRVWIQVEEIWKRAMHGWRVHDMKRPQPPVIDPGIPGTQEAAGKAPSDAIVLFDGKDLTRWEGVLNGPAKWLVKDGYLEIVPGTGDIRTIDSFGDCQLHIEWRIPDDLKGDGYDSGNSGIFMMSKYEIQIFDSYRTRKYADGFSGSIYGEFPPEVNACTAPGKWQTFDIIFHRPHFDINGAVTTPAVITILQNGILVQDNTQILGPTRYMSESPYEVHEDKLPFSLQDHGNPVRFRNIWIRQIPARNEPVGDEYSDVVSLTAMQREQLQGVYGKGMSITIIQKDGKLWARVASLPYFELVALSGSELTGKRVDSRFIFEKDSSGQINALTWYHAGVKSYLKKSL